MTKDQLMYSALLALTQQNMAYKIAPLSTATHSGMCINRNITVGETVGLYYNNDGSLLRIGDVPGYSGDYWVDDDDRFYTYDSTNHRLIIKDGLSGETLSDTIDAYGFSVAGTKTCCAYKSSEDEKEWVVIMPDGHMSHPIRIISNRTPAPAFGYRNGIIGVCVGLNSGRGGVEAYTYTADGQYLNTMNKGNEAAPDTPLVIPINENAVAYACRYLTLWVDLVRNHFSIASTTGYASYNMWSGYNTEIAGSNSTNVWLGADQSFVYVSARLWDSEEEVWTDQYPIGRFSIDDYNGLELLRTETNNAYSSMSATQKGTIVHSSVSDGSTVRTMLDLTTMTEIYGDVLTNIPNNPRIRENDGYIWIGGMGVYQKTPIGWLMYPTSEYPRNDDNQLLGYAIRNVKIGNVGLAIVLFE